MGAHRFAFSVRMFVAPELGDRLRGAGFASVPVDDDETLVAVPDTSMPAPADRSTRAWRSTRAP
jgi:hypothetical protein